MATRYYFFLAPQLPTASIVKQLAVGAAFAVVAPTYTESPFTVVTIDDTAPNESDLFAVMAALGYTFVASTLVAPVFGQARNHGVRAAAPTEPAPAVGDTYFNSVFVTWLVWTGAAWVGLSGSQRISATGTISTSSAVFVLVTGMTVTPAAGIYDVIFSSSVDNTISPAQFMEVAIFVGGVRDVNSTERASDSTGFYVPIFSIAKATVNGAQAIEARWRVTGGSASMYVGRNLLIRRTN